MGSLLLFLLSFDDLQLVNERQKLYPVSRSEPNYEGQQRSGYRKETFSHISSPIYETGILVQLSQVYGPKISEHVNPFTTRERLEIKWDLLNLFTIGCSSPSSLLVYSNYVRFTNKI